MLPRDIVRKGYDRVSLTYRGDILPESSETFQQYRSWIVEFVPLIPRQSGVLDLGCGCMEASHYLMADFGRSGLRFKSIIIVATIKKTIDAIQAGR